MTPATMLRAERLTLAVLMCGVASLALSDFVSPGYWMLAALAAILRLFLGPRLALSELQASLVGWAGFVWVGLELVMGRALIVAFTDFMLILSTAVTIEAATPRNHLHRMLVGLFLLLAAAVLTDSVLYIVPVAAFLWFMWRAAACLYGLNWPGGDLPNVSARQDLPMMLGIAVVTALMFVLLPRFEMKSLLKPTQPRMETSGFSDRVELGDFARKLDATVVLRVEALTGDSKQAGKLLTGRYWRGVALGRFSGAGWAKLSERDIRQVDQGSDLLFAKSGGTEIAVYREASDHPYIELPDGVRAVLDVPDAALLDAGGAMRFKRPPSRRVRLLMRLGARTGLKSGPLPDLAPPLAGERDRRTVPDAVSSWVASLARPGDAPAETLQRVDETLHGWTYDLNAPIDAAHPIASFLKNKRGHCELYATTLALAARALGYPARVVNGYFGGDWNPVGGFLLIREQNAHSWTEVWRDGHWQRMDATPASRWQLSAVRFPALDDVWESVRLTWYRYVLEFQNQDRQGLAGAIWQAWRSYGMKVLAILTATVLLALLFRGGMRRLAGTSIFNTSALSMLDRWLTSRGIVRPDSQPVRLLPTPEGVDAGAWQAFVTGLEAQAYGSEATWSRIRLRRELRALCRSRW